jgi:integrase
MARKPKPFYRKQTKCWYVQIGDKQIRLARERSEAFAKYYQIIASHEPVDVQSCAEIAHRFLNWVKSNRAVRTHEWYAYFLNIAMPVLNATACREFKPYHLTHIIDSTKQLGQNSRHNLARAICAMFSWAVRQGFIGRSPIEHFRKPAQISREDAITPSEFAALLSQVKCLNFRMMLEFSWETGVRPQEIFCFEVRHFEPEFNRIVLPRSESKGKKAIRIVYLTDRAVSLVEQSIGQRKDGHIFVTQKGTPWNRCNVNSQFYRIKKATGKRYHLGSIRKGYITEALKNGVDTVTLSHLVGHSDLTMISRVYAKMQQDPEHMLSSAEKAKLKR